MFLHESFRDDQDATNTCLLHVHPPGPHSGTVTCILEVLSPQWLLSIFFGPFVFDGLSERTLFFFKFFYTENVNKVGGRESLGCEELCFSHQEPFKVGNGDRWRSTPASNYGTMPSFSEESRRRTSTILMFVNINVQMQKHILSVCYHPRKHVWFPVTIPADVLQWFKEARRFKKTKNKNKSKSKKKKQNPFCKILYFLKKLSCFIQTLLLESWGWLSEFSDSFISWTFG